jgi:outer membrane receptor protein involved in Fe transport
MGKPVSFTFFSLFLFSFHFLWAQQESKDSIITMKDVVVLASRKPEAFLSSPMSIQKADRLFFANSPSSSFFESLAGLRGMQTITPSMGFKIFNTRGFNNTTNVRFVQLVDGLDVQSPHIGSPIGNALGPSDLDIKKVELLPGLAATLYGMNAINGLADFTTRDPYVDKGLSFQQKTALTHLGSDNEGSHVFSETSIRYAHTIGSRWAVKFNLTHVQGYDWLADDRKDLNPLANASTGLLSIFNPAADPVNGYGNESSNRRTLSLGGKSYVVSRTGYFERDVVDYGLRNTKADLMLKWKSQRGASVSYTARVSQMDNVYQRANRFRLQDYFIQQHALQFSQHGFKANLYLNAENTGNSYNLRSMAENMDRSFKSDNKWFADYAAAYNAANNGSLMPAILHQMARVQADQGRFVPGSLSFEEQRMKLQQINNWDSGAALKVQATFIQADLQWNLTEKLLSSLQQSSGIDLVAGFDVRQHITTPDGNYFINPQAGKSGKNLLYTKMGAFVSLQKEMLQQKLKLGFALRADKNDYFKLYYSPRLTTVYRPNTRTSFRANAQIGYRFPIIFEAFTNVNSGGVKRVGGLPIMSNGIFENGWIQTSIAAFQSAVLNDMNRNGSSLQQAITQNKSLLQKSPYSYLQPERVKSVEVGFRRMFGRGHFLLDADIYLNHYKAFIAQVNMNVPNTTVTDSIPFFLYDRTKQKPYRMWTNSLSAVQNHGFGVGVSYLHPKSFLFSSHVSYTRLTKRGQQDGLEDGFNTPSWTAVMSVSTHESWKQWKASAAWRWQDAFQWVSFLVSGHVPAYQSLDASVEYSFQRQPLQVKCGANNLMNRSYRSFLGGPSVGGFYYMTLTFGAK